MQTYIDSVVNGEDFVSEDIERMKSDVINAHDNATKLKTYLALNPQLTVHELYSPKGSTVADYLRITFSRFRLSSHRLRVEIGRWSRTPRTERTCSCGLGIQDEEHIFVCPRVKIVFETLQKQCSSPADLFNETSVEDLRALHQALELIYEDNSDSAA